MVINWALAAIFVLGMANAALHRAVLASGHPVVRRMLGAGGKAGPLISLGLEFVLLAVAMLVVAGGAPAWGWAYVAYSLINAGLTWAMLTGRF